MNPNIADIVLRVQRLERWLALHDKRTKDMEDLMCRYVTGASRATILDLMDRIVPMVTPVLDDTMSDDVGKNIRTARLLAGLTQKEAASRLGWKWGNTLGYMERGQRSPTLSTLKKMAELFGCELRHLVGQ